MLRGLNTKQRLCASHLGWMFKRQRRPCCLRLDDILLLPDEFNKPGGLCQSLLQEPLGVQLDARAHGAGHRHASEVGALGGGRFCPNDGVHQNGDILVELLRLKGGLAHGNIHDAGTVSYTHLDVYKRQHPQ